MTEGSTGRRPRGWISLYLVAFALLVASGVALAASVRGFLESIGLLWTSIGLSLAALVIAVASVVLPRRR